MVKEWQSGEIIYRFPTIYPNVHIRCHSTLIIGLNRADECGENSIRLYIMPDKLPPSKTKDAYTNRKPGWDERLRGKLKELQGRIRGCSKPNCWRGAVIYTSKGEKNKGRKFVKCSAGHFAWLDIERLKRSLKSQIAKGGN
jgi:hypothetical protein